MDKRIKILKMNNHFSLITTVTSQNAVGQKRTVRKWQTCTGTRYNASVQRRDLSQMPSWSFSKVNATFKNNLNWLNTCLIILYYLPSIDPVALFFVHVSALREDVLKSTCARNTMISGQHLARFMLSLTCLSLTSIGSSLKLLSPSLHRHLMYLLYSTLAYFCIFLSSNIFNSWKVELHLDSLCASGAPDACLLTTRACCLLPFHS